MHCAHSGDEGHEFIVTEKSISYFKNHDPVDFGGKNNPVSGGMMEPNVCASSLHIFHGVQDNKDKSRVKKCLLVYLKSGDYLDEGFLFGANKKRGKSVSFFSTYDVKIVACKKIHNLALLLDIMLAKLAEILVNIHWELI